VKVFQWKKIEHIEGEKFFWEGYCCTRYSSLCSYPLTVSQSSPTSIVGIIRINSSLAISLPRIFKSLT